MRRHSDAALLLDIARCDLYSAKVLMRFGATPAAILKLRTARAFMEGALVTARPSLL